MFRRLAAGCAFALSAAAAAAQPGPQLLTVSPPGAKAGDTVEVTVAGAGFDGGEQLLFSDPKVKGEPVSSGAVALDPKAKRPDGGGGGRMATPQASAAAKFKVTVPKDLPPTTLDVRVVSKNGLSNPRAFVVGTLPEAAEQEPNNDVAQAQKVELDSTVNGTVAAPTDVDYFAFRAKAGQHLVVACLTTAIDSKLQAELLVVGADGKALAANRGYRDGDAVLDFVAPTEGDYLVRVAQFAYTTGGPDHFYRLTITTGGWVDAVYPPVASAKGFAVAGRNVAGRAAPAVPASAAGTLRTARVVGPAAGGIDAIDPTTTTATADAHPLLLGTSPVIPDNESNETADAAQVVTPPCDIAGRIEKKNDRDWYSFVAKKGEVWTLEVFADRLGSPVDMFFLLTDDKGKVIAEVDDGPDALSPHQFYTKSDDPGRYRFSVPADGTYRVMVSSREAAVQFGVRDQYVLRIAREKPDFRLAVMPVGTHYPDAGTLPKGGAVQYTVYAWRFDGFDGPIALSAADLPPGVTCPPQVIGPGQTRGTLVLAAAPGAADWAGFVTVKGTATAGDAELVSVARPFSVVWAFPGVNPGQQPPAQPVITRMDRGPGLAVAVRGDAPFALARADAGPLKVKAGEKVEFAVKLTRTAGFKDAVQVYATLPAGDRRGGGGGNNPPPPLAAIAADKSEAKVTLDIPATLPSGTYSVVLRGQAGAAPAKDGGGRQAKVLPSYPAVPVTIEVENKTPPKKGR